MQFSNLLFSDHEHLEEVHLTDGFGHSEDEEFLFGTSQFLDGMGVFLKRHTFRGETLLYFKNGMTINKGTEQTLVLPNGPHFIHTVLCAINHSCQPNCMFDSKEMSLKALSNLSPFEELTVDYETMPWSVEKQFTCSCQRKACRRYIFQNSSASRI